MAKDDFNLPPDLSPQAKKIALAIVATVQGLFGKDASGGGCRAFYSPAEWIKRGEAYGHNALSIVVHDGGDVAPFFDVYGEEYSLEERMSAELKKLGVYAEPATCWYTCIYPA